MESTLDLSKRAWSAAAGSLDQFLDWSLSSGLQILLILILAWVARLIIRQLTSRMHRFLLPRAASREHEKRADTLTGIVRTTATILISVATVIMVLQEIGIEIGPILAGAGIMGLAIGFGAQSIVKDVLSGFFLLLEDQMRIGDVVEVGGDSGVVEGISLRTLRLRDLDGNLHIIPHGSFSAVTNMTKDFSCYIFDVGVAYREDTDEVSRILEEIGLEMQEDPAWKDDILRPLEIFGVNSFDDSAVVVRARITTKPIRQWAVGREFNRRMKKRFDQEGIEIPFPHRTLYWGQGKDGSAPPVRLEQETK